MAHTGKRLKRREDRMNLKELKPTTIIKCVRCGKAEFVGNAKLWNVDFNKGVPTCFICPDCQTQEEFIEAEVNEATTDYTKATVIHNLDELLEHFRPLWRKALKTIARGKVERGNAELNDCLEKFRQAFNSMFRYDAQLNNVEETFLFLQEYGEFPQL